MLRFYSTLIMICAVLLLIFGITLWTDPKPAFSDTSNTVPKKQFVLPPKNESGLTRSQMHGKAMYLYYCATCHGDTGNGDGFNSFSITPPPAKLSDAKIMNVLSDATIEKTIKEGGTGVGLSKHMPPWGGVFTDKNIQDLTHFIRTLSSPPKSNAPPNK